MDWDKHAKGGGRLDQSWLNRHCTHRTISLYVPLCSSLYCSVSFSLSLSLSYSARRRRRHCYVPLSKKPFVLSQFPLRPELFIQSVHFTQLFLATVGLYHALLGTIRHTYTIPHTYHTLRLPYCISTHVDAGLLCSFDLLFRFSAVLADSLSSIFSRPY